MWEGCVDATCAFLVGGGGRTANIGGGRGARLALRGGGAEEGMRILALETQVRELREALVQLRRGGDEGGEARGDNAEEVDGGGGEGDEGGRGGEENGGDERVVEDVEGDAE